MIILFSGAGGLGEGRRASFVVFILGILKNFVTLVWQSGVSNAATAVLRRSVSNFLTQAHFSPTVPGVSAVQYINHTNPV